MPVRVFPVVRRSELAASACRVSCAFVSPDGIGQCVECPSYYSWLVYGFVLSLLLRFDNPRRTMENAFSCVYHPESKPCRWLSQW